MLLTSLTRLSAALMTWQPSTLGTASYPRQLLCTPDGGRLVGVGEGGEVYAINPR